MRKDKDDEREEADLSIDKLGRLRSIPPCRERGQLIRMLFLPVASFAIIR